MRPAVVFAVVALTSAPLHAVRAQRLSLGDAARLAAKQNGAVDVARARVSQASARVTQRRGALLPDLAAGVQQAERTLNSATFGFSFNNPATGRPLLRPDGELLGPIPTLDLRYRVQAPLLDLGKYQGWRAAQAIAGAASLDVEAQAEAAAAQIRRSPLTSCASRVTS
jgi:hypothetical protein